MVYQHRLHQFERQRREREATLRRLREESQLLVVAVGAVVPTDVARLMELELQLDQAYQRHHAQTLAMQKASIRIKALREKLPGKEQHVVDKRQELAMVAEEIAQRGEALAEASNKAQHARGSLAELQERVSRQSAARQQELVTLQTRLGVDVLARDIQTLEQQLSALTRPSIALAEMQTRKGAYQRELERLRHRSNAQRSQKAALVSKRRHFEGTRRYSSRDKLDNLQKRAAEVAANMAALRTELADMDKLAERCDMCAAQLADAEKALDDSKRMSLQQRRNDLELERKSLTQRRALVQVNLDGLKSAATTANLKAAQLRREVLEEDACLPTKRNEMERECNALKLSAEQAWERVRTTESELKNVRQKLEQISSEQISLGRDLADAETRVRGLEKGSHQLRVTGSNKPDSSAIQRDLEQINAECALVRTRSAALADELEIVQRKDKAARSTAERLEEEKRQLSSFRSREAGLHQEIERLQDEIAKLEELHVEAQADAASAEPRVARLQKALAEATADAEARTAVVQAEVEAGSSKRVAALQAISSIDARLLEEIRSMPSPPPGVELTMNAVLVILGKGSQPTWVDVRRALDESHFIHDLMNFARSEESSISEDTLDILMEYIRNDDFNEARVSRASKAAGPLCSWVKAQADYALALTKQRKLDIELGRAEKSLQKQRDEYAGALRVVEAAAKLQHRLHKTHSDLEDRTVELKQVEIAATSQEQKVVQLQGEYETLRRETLDHSAEATIKETMDSKQKQLAELEQCAEKYSSDLANAQTLKKELESANDRLSHGKKQQEEIHERSAQLKQSRDQVVAEHHRLEGIISEARGLAETDEGRAKLLSTTFNELEAGITAKRAKMQAEIVAQLGAAAENDRAADEAEVELVRLSSRLQDNESALAEIKSSLELQTPSQLKLEKHHDQQAAAVATLRKQLESLRQLAGTMRARKDVEDELQDQSQLPDQMAQAIVEAEITFKRHHQEAEEDTKIAESLDEAIGAATAAAAATTQAIDEIRVQVERDRKSEASLVEAARTASQQQETIRKQLAQLHSEMELKTNKRPAEVDRKTGLIVPPHQAHIDPRWTRGAPKGNVERMRCLSAGPSPNMLPTAWPSSLEQHLADEGGSHDAVLGDIDDAYRQELLAQAWHAIAHATGVSTEAEIIERLLKHAEKHERLQISKTELDEQRTCLRDKLRHYKQEFADIMYCGSTPSISQLEQRKDGSEMQTFELQAEDVQRLRNAEVQLRTTDAKLTSLMAVLAEVGPGLKHLVQSCGSGMPTDLRMNNSAVDDDITSLLSMLERRVSLVLNTLEGAGFQVEPDMIPLRVSARMVGGQGGETANPQDRSKAKASKRMGRAHQKPKLDPNVRVPSRAMLELQAAGASDSPGATSKF